MALGFKERKQASENKIYTDVSDRINNIRQDDLQDTPSSKPLSIDIYDIDLAIDYYFNSELKLSVSENGQQILVPIMYGSPERWLAMKHVGFYRDEQKGKIILPLVMYRRTSISDNEQLKFPRLKELVHIFKYKWDRRNKYSRFSAIDKNLNSDRYLITAIPNYVKISYECIIWTTYVEQLNKIIEQIIFSKNRFWGDPNKFIFRADFDSVETPIELNDNEQRMVKASFSINLDGYILPKSINNEVNTTRIGLSPKTVIFNENIE